MKELKFRLKIYLTIFLSVMMLSILGIMYFENMSFARALYFSVVTVSTVGFGDVTPVTQAGQYTVLFMILMGVGTFLGVIATLTEMMLNRREYKIRMQKLHILIGLFFSEVGNRLLIIFLGSDPQIDGLCSDINLVEHCKGNFFKKIAAKVTNYDYLVNKEQINYVEIKKFLGTQKEFLIRLLENPVLIDHENFTELIRALFHLFEELNYRVDATHMQDDDKDHIRADIHRVYRRLITQWINYMEYIQKDYPYLYKYSMKMNPFIRDCRLVTGLRNDIF